MAEVKVEARALLGIVIMMSVHILVETLVEEILTDIMVGAGCLEAEVLVIEESEVEAQQEGTGIR